MSMNIKATEAQIKYIEILAIDLKLDRHERNSYIKEHIGREMHYLDDLTKSEASDVINYFRELKGE